MLVLMDLENPQLLESVCICVCVGGGAAGRVVFCILILLVWFTLPDFYTLFFGNMECL